MAISAIGIIPARYASTRFPGKPLALIGGKSMIRRVYEQASQCRLLQKVAVATDDRRIADHVASFGGQVVMTSADHVSGTSRIGEAMQMLAAGGGHGYDVVVNIQGDEPFIDPLQIELLISLFEDSEVQIATLVKKITLTDELFSPNVVKVVTGQSGKALYFSRSAVPYLRGFEQEQWTEKAAYFKHIGIYALKTTVLQQLIGLPPAAAELAESLEQLRWLAHGYSIHTAVTDIETVSIDTPGDLLKVTNNL